ncbi:MAG TPA: 2-hydroxy-3-oxopropionate reductase [Candidatus Cryosericum sp.]
MRIGFIGLGIMGRPMARNLLRAGYSLIVYDRTAPLSDMVSLGAESAASSREVASRSDVIITMLPNSPDVREAVLGADGIASGARAGSILVDMSSIAPRVSQELAGELQKRGVPMLDAPVSGGQPKAEDGTLAIMVGGDPAVFEAVRPILEKMGSTVTLVGPIGSGGMAKLANQIIVALNIAAVSEAFVLSTRAGLDPEVVFEAIKGGLAGSTVMDVKLPSILDGNFEPGFRIQLHIKDLVNAVDTAHDLGVPVPLTVQVLETLRELEEQGLGAADHSAIIRHYEELAHTEVRRRHP